MVSVIGVDVSSHLQGFFLTVDVRHPDWRHQRKKMGQKGFSSERKCYHPRIRFVFFGNYIFIGFQCFASYSTNTALEGWPEAPALHVSSPHCIFASSSGGGGIPRLLLQAQFGDLAYALVSLAMNCTKWSCSDATDSRTWSAKHCYRSYCTSKGKKV